jgi:hypothetical protein
MDDVNETGKVCCTCRRRKPLSDFNRLSKAKDGRQPRCRDCHAAYHQANKARINRMIHARNRRLDFEFRERLFDYLAEHPCVDCGETDLAVLEFDHVRGKTMNMSRMVINRTSWDLGLKEIGLCEVVCANCHRRRTNMRANTHRWRRALANK